MAQNKKAAEEADKTKETEDTKTAEEAEKLKTAEEEKAGEEAAKLKAAEEAKVAKVAKQQPRDVAAIALKSFSGVNFSFHKNQKCLLTKRMAKDFLKAGYIELVK